MLAHAHSTESEEVMGLLLGDVTVGRAGRWPAASGKAEGGSVDGTHDESRGSGLFFTMGMAYASEEVSASSRSRVNGNTFRRRGLGGGLW